METHRPLKYLHTKPRKLRAEAPENGWLEDDEISLWGPTQPLVGAIMLVSGNVIIDLSSWKSNEPSNGNSRTSEWLNHHCPLKNISLSKAFVEGLALAGVVYTLKCPSPQPKRPKNSGHHRSFEHFQQLTSFEQSLNRALVVKSTKMALGFPKKQTSQVETKSSRKRTYGIFSGRFGMIKSNRVTME